VDTLSTAQIKTTIQARCKYHSAIMAFVRVAADPPRQIRDPFPPLDYGSQAEYTAADEAAGVEREKLFSREDRLRRLADWARAVEESKKRGYIRPDDPPLVFPEPLAGMRRHPATGHLMGDQPRKYGP
jgi:hypothetical protein